MQVFEKRMDVATTEEYRIDSTTDCTLVNGSATSGGVLLHRNNTSQNVNVLGF